MNNSCITIAMLRQFILLIFISISFICRAQSFSEKSEIPAVEKSQYYYILISPDVSATAQRDLSDIRIRNNKSGKEEPYLISSVNTKKEATLFQHYKIEENVFNPKDSSTHVIISNESKEKINHFGIVIQNADISKYISLRGSDDKNNWYIVKQRSVANPGMQYDEKSEILIADFPTGNYRYYEIKIDNPENEPVRVLEVGRYEYHQIIGQYTEIPLGDFQRKDSTDKKTYITFPRSGKNYLVSKIYFDIANKQPYLRQSRLRNLSFILSSKTGNAVEVNDLRIDSTFIITIDNKDDAPLKINKITAFEQNRYLTVFLEEGENYTLYCGDKNLQNPQYDLAYFEENIPKELPVLELNPLVPVDKTVIPPAIPAEKSFLETPVFLWSVIAIVGLLLLWICYAMVKDLKNKRPE